ncbi:MAG: hypothetical protein ABI639_07310 [Thermoanaerobaculia bacterium]
MRKRHEPPLFKASRRFARKFGDSVRHGTAGAVCSSTMSSNRASARNFRDQRFFPLLVLFFASLIAILGALKSAERNSLDREWRDAELEHHALIARQDALRVQLERTARDLEVSRSDFEVASYRITRAQGVDNALSTTH